MSSKLPNPTPSTPSLKNEPSKSLVTSLPSQSSLLVPTSPTQQPSIQTTQVTTSARKREDSIALLTGLTDNNQLAPAIKAICDRGWTGTFTGFLDRAVQQKDMEILTICNEHFEDLIYTIDHVLAAKTQAVGLRKEIVQLHRDLQETSRNLLTHSIGLNNERVILQNLMITIHVLEKINSTIFVSLSQAFQQMEEKRYFIALKTLAYVQNELPKYQGFNFSSELDLQIPVLAQLIKSIVRQEFETWIFGLKDRGPVLGYFTMHSVHLKLFDIHRKYHIRLQEFFKDHCLELNPCYLMKHVTFATTTSGRGSKRSAAASTTQQSQRLGPISPSNDPNGTKSNVYTLVDLNLGCQINIFDPHSQRQPYSVLLHTRPSSINKSVLNRTQQMKAAAKKFNHEVGTVAINSSNSSNNRRGSSTFTSGGSSSVSTGSRRNSITVSSNNPSRPGSSSKSGYRGGTTVVESESEEEYDDGSEDEFGFGIRKKSKSGKKIKKKRKRTTTTTTTHRVFKDGKWVDVPNSSSDSDGDEIIAGFAKTDEDYEDDDYDDNYEESTEKSETKTITSPGSGSKTTVQTSRSGVTTTTTRTTTTTTSSSSSSSTSSSTAANTTSSISSALTTSEQQLKDKRRMRAKAALSTKSNALNTFRRANNGETISPDLYNTLDSLEEQDEDDSIDVSNSLTMFTLTAMSAANISFIPLYQCLHVYQSLGQLPAFRSLYSTLRHTQATTQVKVLSGRHTSPYNSSGYYNHSQNVANTLYSGNTPTGGQIGYSRNGVNSVNPVAEYHKPKTKIQSYLPTAAALPTSLSTFDDIKPVTNAKNNAPRPSVDMGKPVTVPSPSQSPQHSTKIVSLLQLQQLYAEIMGFFVLEESIIRTGARLLSRTELESLWERASMRVKLVLSEHLATICTIQDFLLVKECTMIFLTTMESYRFNVNTLYEFLAQQLPTFKDLCVGAFVLELNKLSTIDRFEPLTLYSHNDYFNLVIATGLTPPRDSNGNDITNNGVSIGSGNISLAQGDLAGRPVDYPDYDEESTSSRLFGSVTSPGGGSGGGGGGGGGNNNQSSQRNMPFVPAQFPVTMPFSVSIPLITILVRTFTSLLFEYAYGLILPSGSLSANITTYASLLLKELVVEFLSRHKGGSGTLDKLRNASSPKKETTVKQDQELLYNSTSVPLAVQARMNAFYMSIFSSNMLKLLNGHIEQRLGDNSPVLHLSCTSSLTHTVEAYDRFIIDTLKHKVDRISYIEEFPWLAKQFLKTPSDSMLDLTTFLHTTLSCTIFLPALTRQDVCIHTYEHIAQSIVFALQFQGIEAFTQMALYNFLHDIHEFELLSNTYQASTYQDDVHNAQLTGGIDKKSHRENVKVPMNNESKDFRYGTQTAIFAAMNQHSKDGSGGGNNQNDDVAAKKLLDLQIMTPTTSKSMLTVSFQRLRQFCLLFVSNDFESFLDPERRVIKYNLLDGIFLLKVCSKFKEAKGVPTDPNSLPIGVKYVKRTDVDTFEYKLQRLIKDGQL
jgi:hypothetical protein